MLRPSELDVFTVKAEVLENQQKNLEKEVLKKERKKRAVLNCAAIYLAAFALILLLHFITLNNQLLWETFPGATLPAVILLAATAAAVIIYVKNMNR